MTADPHEHARAALAILTAWVTEGEDFAVQYAVQQSLAEDGTVSPEALLVLATGNLRLSALLLRLLVDRTGRPAQEILQIVGQEIA